MLPIQAFEPAFTPYFATPHGLDFQRVAAVYDLPYLEVESVDELVSAVSAATTHPGVEMIHIRTDRNVNAARHGETRDAVRKALAAYTH